jgi:hypothetical protein
VTSTCIFYLLSLSVARESVQDNMFILFQHTDQVELYSRTISVIMHNKETKETSARTIFHVYTPIETSALRHIKQTLLFHQDGPRKGARQPKACISKMNELAWVMNYIFAADLPARLCLVELLSNLITF